MSPTLSMAGAIALTSALLIGFAFFRRIMRSPNLPSFLNSNVVAFGAALSLTVLIMLSMMSLGFAFVRFTNSAVWSGVLTIVSHFAIWAVARIIVPLRDEQIVVGNSIMGIGTHDGGLPAH